MHRALRRRPFSLGVVLALVVAAFVAVVAPTATAQTAADVEARDQLIANQENLLNTYRCLFRVDTEVVPGGCPNPDTVTPGVSPTNPTPQDIEVRDGLIQNQEALLNVYRCRFDVDTQIVPGGCIDGAPAPVVEVLPPLGPPPAELGFDPFYQKYLDASGIPIVTSAAVPDAALYKTRVLIHEMLANRPDILEALANSGMHVTLIAEGSVITDIPEFSNLYEEFPGTDWDVAILGGGLGPTTHIPVMAAVVENVLCLESDQISPFEDVMVHEIGHAVLTMAIDAQMGDTDFRPRLKAAYQSALDAGLWKHTYAATNVDEYWAEGTQSWFDLNGPPYRTQNNINTRAELLEYDPALAALLDEVYGDASVPSSCHETVDTTAYGIEGVILSPDDQPIEAFFLWILPGDPHDSTWAIVETDGSFFTRAKNDSYVIHVYRGRFNQCSFIGWHGGEGLVDRIEQATVFEVDGADIEGIEIKLSDAPENIPYLTPC
ncbi:MAG: hypothetical protein F4129_08100 [Acidimicrobiia bacterium]|nr:hypothetical protein [Acidimicrobiia bacterium]MYL09171.1 hypothetical protein [Acidimicrobiia bacterium]